jgi:hypothetical protein
MDQPTLKSDIDMLASVLTALAGIAPNAPRLQSYIATIQGIAEQPLLLALLCTLVNGIAQQPTQPTNGTSKA